MTGSAVRVNRGVRLVEPAVPAAAGAVAGRVIPEIVPVRRPVQRLMERAEQQGYLTMDDLLELLPESEESLPRVEKLMTSLARSGVEIIMPDEVEAQAALAETASPQTEPADLSDIDSHDAIAMYFREMGQVPLLTRAQEVRLAKQMERGQVARRRLQTSAQKPALRERYVRQVELGKQARAHLVRANTRLVISIAKRYRRLGVPFLDLIQEGNLGLLKAVGRFDHHRGCKLSTYATWWIRQSITRALGEQSRVIRLPSYIVSQVHKMKRAAQDLEQKTGQQPTAQQVAAKLGLTCARVRWLVRISRHVLSLQKPVGEEEDSELGEFIADEDSPAPSEAAEASLLAERMDHVLSTLTPRQERILRLRYGLHDGRSHTLKEVADKFGLTRERIRQIERKALRRLRHPVRSRRLRSFLS